MAEAQKSGKLNMKHGFMKSIVRNQLDRDNYDKEVKATKQTQKGRNPLNTHTKKPAAAVYIPPSRKENFVSRLDTEQFENSSEEHEDQPQDSSPPTNLSQSPQAVGQLNGSKNTDKIPSISDEKSEEVTVNSTQKHPNEQNGKSRDTDKLTGTNAQSATVNGYESSSAPKTQNVRNVRSPNGSSRKDYRLYEMSESLSQNGGFTRRRENAGSNQNVPVDNDEDDDMPRTLFIFEFEDKDGKIYKQYVKEGFTAELLAERMGYDRKLPPKIIKALEQRLQEEIDKRTKAS